ncbi:MerR family transcriptional regulator [Streptomyces filamentosus]|uniref:MerR family transcriptional regulator n=1 Tax=Streptomyces filamentosus TaxID=67294 RepID=UPI0036EC5C60
MTQAGDAADATDATDVRVAPVAPGTPVTPVAPGTTLTIGDFARVTGLSAKALRRYDELGLLRPARVDPYNGYRHYAAAQTERARLIAWLRRIGMPLGEIGRVCALYEGDAAGAEAAARAIRAYWASVEADTAARRDLADSLVARVKGNPTDMTTTTTTTTAMDRPAYALTGATALLDPGLVRATQQDAAHASERLLAVADGYGPEGGRAARAAIGALAAVTAPARAGGGLDALEDGMRAAAGALAGLDGSGTTLTAALLAGGRLALLHVGDSRAYLLRDGRTRQLTRDDTVVQELVDAGGLDPEEAAARPDRALLLKALDGGGAVPVPSLAVHEVRPGDRLLLCTDGLSALVPPADLARVFADAPTPGAAAEALRAHAHALGAPDNLSLTTAEVTLV